MVAVEGCWNRTCHHLLTPFCHLLCHRHLSATPSAILTFLPPVLLARHDTTTSTRVSPTADLRAASSVTSAKSTSAPAKSATTCSELALPPMPLFSRATAGKKKAKGCCDKQLHLTSIHDDSASDCTCNRKTDGRNDTLGDDEGEDDGVILLAKRGLWWNFEAQYRQT